MSHPVRGGWVGTLLFLLGILAWGTALLAAAGRQHLRQANDAGGVLAGAVGGGLCFCAAGISRRPEPDAFLGPVSLYVLGWIGFAFAGTLSWHTWYVSLPAYGSGFNNRDTEIVGAVFGFSFGIGAGLAHLGYGLSAASRVGSGKGIAIALLVSGLLAWSVAALYLTNQEYMYDKELTDRTHSPTFNEFWLLLRRPLAGAGMAVGGGLALFGMAIANRSSGRTDAPSSPSLQTDPEPRNGLPG